MAADAEGYGFKQGEEGLDRLFNDARVLSPAGIERAAWGWDRHEDQAALQGFHDAEREALRALEQADRINTWDAARKRALVDPREEKNGVRPCERTLRERSVAGEHAPAIARVAVERQPRALRSPPR